MREDRSEKEETRLDVTAFGRVGTAADEGTP
jgi:hypothetical protein